LGRRRVSLVFCVWAFLLITSMLTLAFNIQPAKAGIPAPTLYSPGNGSTVNTGKPTFDWSDVTGATYYAIMVDNNSDWSSPEVYIWNLSISNYAPTTTLMNGKYYWTAAAYVSGAWGPWASAWSFTVDMPTTIYIRADGSIDPPIAPIQRNGDLYTLIGNITSDADGIVIERNNMILDGAGYTVKGIGFPSSLTGINLTGRSNVTIRNTQIKKFWTGIFLQDSSNNNISDNTITSNGIIQYGGGGIRLNASSNNIMYGNNITANNDYGIAALSSSSNYNNITGNNIAYSPVGVYLTSSNHNSIVGNNITNNGRGIELYPSFSNSISGNKITNNSDGITLYFSSNNNISGNKITKHNWYGTWLHQSSNNSLVGNNITNNQYSISLSTSSNNTIVGNNMTVNDVGISLFVSSNNKIFHNNFVNNTKQVYDQSWDYSWTTPSINVWDDGYPSGGNYWSNYTGVDMKSGLNQNLTGSDGIGDTPYVIDAYNRDRYPLMKPWTPTLPTPDFSITASPTSLTIQQGSSNTLVITITSIGGFNQPVQLEPPEVPGSPLATLSPEQVTPPPDGSATSTLTISVATTAPPGSYTLTVTGTSGALTYRVNIFLKITAPPTENQPPVADAGSDRSVFSGDLVTFNGSNSYDPDGTIVSYQWDFGDGTTAEGKIVSHRFRGTMIDPETHAPRTKDYIVVLTAMDDQGAMDTKSATINVKPLTKRVELSPTHLGTPYMEVTYNWVGMDEATGEDLYIISRIDAHFGGIAGASQFFILRRTSPSPSIPKVIWHIPLPTEWAWNTRTYATPFTPSLWQKLWGTTCDSRSIYYEKRVFPDGTFEGIGVTTTSFILMVASGAQISIIQTYWDAGWAKFDPKSPATSIKKEQLEGMEELYEALQLLRLLIAVPFSPAELRVYDSQGRITGLVNGEKKEEIPSSAYVNDAVIIFYPDETYSYDIVGTEQGAYGLKVILAVSAEITTFNATDIPISTNAIHQYTIDWDALSRGEKGVAVQIDNNGDGTFEKTFTAGSGLTRDEFLLQVPIAEALPMWIVGAGVAIAAIGIVAVATLLLRRRKNNLKVSESVQATYIWILLG